MSPPILIDFGNPAPRPPARVRSLRDMICRPLDGDPRPVAIGEELVVDDQTLCQLTSEDVVFLGRVVDEVDFTI